MTHIGIMSMQRILNYGSTLQAYSLRRILENLDDTATVSYIDYRPGPTLIHADVPRSRLLRTTTKMVAYARVNASLADRVRFLNHKRRYSDQYLPLAGIPTPHNYVTATLDLQVIGSDEVFNCVQANTNVGFSRDLFGGTSEARNVVTYAASFGNTTMEKIDKFRVRSDIEEGMSSLRAISVRDRNSANIVEEITSIRPEVHVDPVLAYADLLSEPSVPASRPHPRPYIVAYGYPGRFTAAENGAIREYARNHGVDVLCLGGVQGCGDRFVDCDPFELLAYFRDAEAVITDTFHGTIFSIISGTQFATIVRQSHGDNYGNEQKMGDLLDTFHLQSRRLDSTSNIESVLAPVLNPVAIGDILSIERDRTRDYLKRAIEIRGAQ